MKGVLDDQDGDKIKLQRKKGQSFGANKVGISSYSFKNQINMGWRRK